MSTANWTLTYKVNLQNMEVTPLSGKTLMYPGNENGHVMKIEVMDGFTKPDLRNFNAFLDVVRNGSTDTLKIEGTLDQNIVSFKFPAEFYAYPGEVHCIARLNAYGVSFTLLDIFYQNGRNLPDGVVVPSGSRINNVDDLMSYIQDVSKIVEKTNQAEDDVEQLSAKIDAEIVRAIAAEDSLKIPNYSLIVDTVLTEDTTRFDVSTSVLSTQKYTDMIAVIATSNNSAAGALRGYAYSSGSESGIGYITLSNAIGTTASVMYAMFRVWNMGNLWNNEGGAGTATLTTQSFAANRFKPATEGAYIRSFYITSTTANVPIPAGATIKVYAR